MSRPLEAKLRISAEVQQALTSLRSVQQELGGLSTEAKAVKRESEGLLGVMSGLRGQLAGLASVATLQTFAREILQARVQAERLQNVLNFTTNGPREAAAELEWLRGVANRLGLDLQTAGEAYVSLQAAARGTALEGEPARRIFEAVAAAATTFGLSAEQTSGALLALQQMISKGVVSSEELKGQLGERLPGAMQIAARAMGVGTQELEKMLASGELLARDFLPRFASQLQRDLGEAPANAAKGASAEINRLSTAIQDLKKTIGDSGFADALVDGLKSMREQLDYLTEGFRGATREGAGLFEKFAAWDRIARYANPLGAARNILAARQQQEPTLDDVRREREQLQQTLGGSGSWQEVLRRRQRIDELSQMEQRLQLDAQIRAGGARGGASLAEQDRRNAEDQQRGKGALQKLIDSAKSDRQKIADERAKFVAEYAKILSPEDMAQAEAAFAKRMQAAGGSGKRLASIRAAYDAELDLLRDAIEREQQANEQRFQDGLTELGDYLATRGRLQRQAAEADLKRLEQERAAAAAGLAQARGLAASGDPQEAARGQEAVLRATDRLAQVEAEIAMRKRDQVDAQRALLRDAEQINRERTRTLAELDDQVKAARGEQLSPAELRAQVEREFADTARRIGNDEEGQARLGQLIDLEAARRQFDQLRTLWQRTTQDMATAEAAVRQQQEAGALTATQAEQQLLALRQQQVPALDAILARMRELAATPDQQSAVRQLEVELGGLRKARTELEETARSSATAEFTQGLTDIATGAKTAKDALTDMVAGFAKAMLNVINQRLAEQLVNSLMGPSGAGGGGGWMGAIGSFVSSLFHTGGVVGTNAGTRRTLPAHTWAVAPRYHGGGIAGLAPGEVPAVLMAGEEVLTEDNPRHIKNAGRSVGGLSVVNNVQISGAQGDDAQAAEAARSLTDTINASIDRWAVRESRPGGLLAGRR